MLSQKTQPIERSIGWKNLGVYARAVRDLTRSPPPELSQSSFSRIQSFQVLSAPSVSYFDVPGAKLGFRHYAASSTDRILVLIHGSACYGDLLHRLALVTSGRNAAHVYTLDMRGHGLSSGKRGHAVSHADQIVDDVAAFVAHLRGSHPASKITLGGHSAGGGVVLSVARSEATRQISSYLFLAPFLGLGSGVDRPHFGGWVKLRKLKLTAISLANAFGATCFNHLTVMDFNVAPTQDPRYVPSWSFNTMLAFGPGIWSADALPISRRKPVLLISLQHDECFRQDLYEDAFRVVAPHASLHRAGSGGHWDLLVDDAAAHLVCDFLAGQSKERNFGADSGGRDRDAA